MPDTVPLKVVPLADCVLQYVWLPTVATVGVGFTRMVKLLEVPEQEFADGVTVTVAVTGALVALVAVNDAMLPEPEAARPIAVLLLVQLKALPETAPLNATAVVADVLHTVWLVTAATVGVGFTVILKATGLPTQLFAVGVTVIVDVTIADVLLLAVKDAIFPEPDAARPMEVVVFVQLFMLLDTELVNATAPVAAVLHTVWLVIADTIGVGFTPIVNVCGLPAQLFAFGVTVIVPVTRAFELFVVVKPAMLPEPEPANPIDVALFTQSNEVPLTEPLNVIAEVLAVLQTVWLVIAATVGVGFTVITNVTGAPQPVL